MPRIEMAAVSKFYGTSRILANDGADLLVEDGEIHAVVGENGAGKSTLMKILYGLETPDSGSLRLDEREVRIPDPEAAGRLGIGMVQQHAEVVGDFSVAENVVLGAEPRRLGAFLDARAALSRVSRLIAVHSFTLDPRARAGELSESELQQLEILRLLYRDARVLVLDEPTALLADQEVEGLFEALRGLRAAGHTIIIITHKVGEVLRIADAVTVMRHGRTLARRRVADLDEAGLAALMMGEACPVRGGEEAPPAPPAASARHPGETVLEFRDVGVRRLRGGRPVVSGLTFTVGRGEILGVCALAGNGLSELEALASGARRPSSGSILLEGHPLPRRRGPRVGYVPADRLHRGSSLHSSVAENLAALDRRRFFPRGLVDRAAMEEFAAASIQGYGIAARPGQRLGTLSGGTIQKVVLARELAGSASFLLFSNPTWGLDLASAAFVRERIREARDRGAAVLVVSSTLDEVLELSDKLAILSRGRLVLEVPRPEADRALLGRAMLGLVGQAGHP